MSHVVTAERVQAWLATADIDSALIVVDLEEPQLKALLDTPKLTGSEVYQGPDGRAAARWISDKKRELETLRAKEHQELLLILQEALINIARRDADLASRLAARTYVNLKTDPAEQRRYDGLLHRFTGVLHRKQD